MKYCEKPELAELGNELSGVVADTFVSVGVELYTTKLASSDKRLIRTLDQQLNDHAIGTDIAGIDGYPEFPHLLSPPVSTTEKLCDRNRSKHTSQQTMSIGTGFPANSNVITTNQTHSNISHFPTTGNATNGGTAFGGVSKRRAHSTPAAASGSPFGPFAEVGNIKQYAYLIAVLNASDPDRDFSALQPSSFERIHNDPLNTLRQTISGLGLTPPANLWSILDEEITLSECKAYSLELPQQFLEDDDTGITWSKMFFFFNKRRKRVMFVYLNTRPASYKRESSSESEGVLGELE